jgi:hypothetical protein
VLERDTDAQGENMMQCRKRNEEREERISNEAIGDAL